MALLLCEDFSGYGTGSSGYSRFIENPALATNMSGVTATINSGAGRGGQNSLRFSAATPGNKNWLSRPQIADRHIIGFAMCVRGNVSFTQQIIGARDGSTNRMNVFYSDGVWSIRNATTAIGSTYSYGLTQNVYTHLEFVYTRNGGAANAATAQLYINGQLVIDASGFTGPAVDRIGLGINNGYPQTDISDLYICDGSGSRNNSHMGDLIVRSCTVDDDVNTSAGTVTGSATFYGAVNESAPDDDDSYITMAGAGSVDLGVETPPSDVGSIRGLMLQARSRREDAGTAVMRLGLSSGGTLSPGVDLALEEQWRYYNQILEVNADTSSPWTRSEVASANFRISRTE